jgi:hypothetical protein
MARAGDHCHQRKKNEFIPEDQPKKNKQKVDGKYNGISYPKKSQRPEFRRADISSSITTE